ncbi:MAG: hypothetical protein EOQ42_14775 [Mesorhizobium sp.]|uniref:hypothetical protein n=1 Tax=Mesorhizobium sp. TaxID=1871066 RepID=UPI000FE741E2|nr:hypothetical protein [Mesorhizobium sp.]RWB32017.1 MAG: hypothetical protein EOQ43_10540 [Mesorhizobium sp.]RWB66192.1 MAG: hypothetical protein EOQ42_14775 [Mesorhizobium sp.]RWF58213.1 MAG: hypothetical protein EOS50_03800 [Mesorhizobium sp.]
MGELALDTHWRRLVLTSVREFMHWEVILVDLYKGPDAGAAQDASYETLRTAMTAALFLHHFAEVAFARGALAHIQANSKQALFNAVGGWPIAADGTNRPDDVKILGEVADAIKHGVLTASHIIHVPKNGRVIEISHTQPLFSEGRQDGSPQVVISTAAGVRSFRAIVENVCRGWINQLNLDPT